MTRPRLCSSAPTEERLSGLWMLLIAMLVVIGLAEYGHQKYAERLRNVPPRNWTQQVLRVKGLTDAEYREKVRRWVEANLTSSTRSPASPAD